MRGNVGADLRALRLARGLTVVEAARRAGLSRSALHRWESGESAPPPEALDRLLQGMEAEPDERARLLATAAPKAAHPSLAATPLGAPVHPGHALKALRARRGLTQTALARAAGVGQPLVAMWESGARAPGGEALGRALAVLGATAEEAAWLAPGAFDRYAPLRDPEEARLRIRRYAPNLYHADPVPLIALERELWELAARDRRWEPALIEAMGYRGMNHVYLGELDEALLVYHRALRLARPIGAWDAAFHALDGIYSIRVRRGMHPSRLVAALKELEPELRDPDALLWCVSEQWYAGEPDDWAGTEHHVRRLAELATAEGEGAGFPDNVTFTRKDALRMLAIHRASEGDVAGAVGLLRRIPAVREGGLLCTHSIALVFAEALRRAGEPAPEDVARAIDAYRRAPQVPGHRHFDVLASMFAWAGLEPISAPRWSRTGLPTTPLPAGRPSP